jgi:hypothetical protein
MYNITMWVYDKNYPHKPFISVCCVKASCEFQARRIGLEIVWDNGLLVKSIKSINKHEDAIQRNKMF